jgi:hypothetical protein
MINGVGWETFFVDELLYLRDLVSKAYTGSNTSD